MSFRWKAIHEAQLSRKGVRGMLSHTLYSSVPAGYKGKYATLHTNHISIQERLKKQLRKRGMLTVRNKQQGLSPPPLSLVWNPQNRGVSLIVVCSLIPNFRFITCSQFSKARLPPDDQECRALPQLSSHLLFFIFTTHFIKRKRRRD